MAARSSKNSLNKGKDGKCELVKDDLDLRDEILYLKKELCGVRKERDRLAIRLRKAEDESRRKDRQIDQLMDPSQNSEIRELLSVKGAAMLMNLKDQNASLIHILMEKNQQIKRMANELKTAKLYSKTSKNEPYRMEIIRLRNMLLKSQEALKEAAQGPQTACISGHSRSSYSSSDGAPSTQELEDLRFMVQSLETHMQYSKELLNKKNQEIATLSRELESVLEGDIRRSSVESGGWKVNEMPLEKSRTRRCASAPILERCQPERLLKSSRAGLQRIRANLQLSPDRQVSLLNLLHGNHGLEKLDKMEAILRSGIMERNDLSLKKEENGKPVSRQVRGEELLEEEELSETVTRVARKAKKSLADATDKTRNGEKRNAREKWKFAVHKVHSARKMPRKVRKGWAKRQQRLHTNPRANDDEVWAIIREDCEREEEENCLQKTPVTNAALPGVPESDNSVCPSNLENEKVADGNNDVARPGADFQEECQSGQIDDDRQTEGADDLKEISEASETRLSKLSKGGAEDADDSNEKPVEIEIPQRPQPKVRKLSLPAKLADRKSAVSANGVETRKMPFMRPAESPQSECQLHPRVSIDSSVDSFEPAKSFQVIAEINNSASISSKNESVIDVALLRAFPETSLDDEDDEDDDDVITI